MNSQLRKTPATIAAVLTIGAAVFAAKTFLTFSPRMETRTALPKPDPIAQKVDAMTLDEKIGQMLIVGFEHEYADDHIRTMITEYHVGGINLLSRNVKNREQTKELIANLQNLAAIPLFIAADQEGGPASRFKFLKETTPQKDIKNAFDAEEIAYRRGKELGDLGVTMNFSPVADYASSPASYIYDRTFEKSPIETGVLASAMISGYQRGGIIAVPKHFPGYGNVGKDPHKNKAALTVNEEELKTNLIPFAKIIENVSTAAIMTAHVNIPSIDEKPATLSSKFLQDILRGVLGFQGVIITDDMEMVSSESSPLIEENALEAVKAGADMIISTYTPQKQISIFKRLKEAVLSGELSEKVIEEAVKRILKLKGMDKEEFSLLRESSGLG